MYFVQTTKRKIKRIKKSLSNFLFVDHLIYLCIKTFIEAQPKYRLMKNYRLLLVLFLLSTMGVFAKDSAFQSGDWEVASTWTKNVEPEIEDTLVIENNDTITVSSNLFYNTAVIIQLKNGATLSFTGKLNLPLNSMIISTGGHIISEGGGNSDKIKIDGVSVWSGNMGDYSGSFIVSIGGILPVQWGSMYLSVLEDTNIRVNWSTYSEKNNDHFILEYSKDLITWEIAEYIQGNGTTSTITYHEAIFTPIYEDHIYIRLKQVDYDGNYEYSSISYIYIKSKHKSKILYYLDIKGNKYTTQPIGLSIIIYVDGQKDKIFRARK